MSELTANEVSAILECTKKTISNYVKLGLLTPYKRNGRNYFNSDEVAIQKQKIIERRHANNFKKKNVYRFNDKRNKQFIGIVRFKELMYNACELVERNIKDKNTITISQVINQVLKDNGY